VPRTIDYERRGNPPFAERVGKREIRVHEKLVMDGPIAGERRDS
jgi:hypothetical protein